MVAAPVIASSCFGKACLLRGHNLVPPPPAGITTAIFSLDKQEISDKEF